MTAPARRQVKDFQSVRMTRDHLAQHSLRDVSPVGLHFECQLNRSLVGDKVVNDGRRHTATLERDGDMYPLPSALNPESGRGVIEIGVGYLERLKAAEVVENMRGHGDAAFLQCEVTEGYIGGRFRRENTLYTRGNQARRASVSPIHQMQKEIRQVLIVCKYACERLLNRWRRIILVSSEKKLANVAELG